jgi:peptidoglycan/LPS O-acetylase OafA/YrhL
VGLERQGAAGVTIFFVLSGVVLTYNFGEKFQSSTRGAATFMRARLARIAPMNIVALLVVTPAVLILSDSTPSLGSWIVNLFMLQSLIPAAGLHLWNIPAWSVSAELFFYAAFPFFAWFVLGRIRRPRALHTLAAIVFAVEVLLFCVAAVATQRWMLGAGKAPADVTTMLERVKFFPGLRIWEFFLGCLVGRALVLGRRGRSCRAWDALDRRGTRDWLLLVAGLALVAIVVMPAVVDTPTLGLGAHLMSPGLYLAYTPIAVVLVAALAWGPTWVSPILEHRWARAMGDATLSFYLLQWTVVLLVSQTTWAPSPRVWWFSAIAAIVLAGTSLLSARWIERPARTWLRGGAPTTRNTP